jgi:GT2 family glycosyltransferase
MNHEGTPTDLSVLIVNWNGVVILEDCLRSVFATPLGIRLEVVVIDNASSDGSQEMVRLEFPQVRLIENADNRGFSAANNQGMQVARGRHVLLLNSDTIVEGDVLERVVRFLDENPRVGALACRVLNRDRTEQQVARPAPHWWRLWLWTLGAEKLAGRADAGRPSRDQLTVEREVGTLAGCFLAVPSETISVVGMLDEDFYFFGEDADWCERIRRSGRRVVQAPVGTIVHLGGASSGAHSHRRDLMLVNGLAVFNRKFHGRVCALLAVTALWVYYITRYTVLRMQLRLGPEVEREHRAVRFRCVIADFGASWGHAWRGRFGAPNPSVERSSRRE